METKCRPCKGYGLVGRNYATKGGNTAISPDKCKACKGTGLVEFPGSSNNTGKEKK